MSPPAERNWAPRVRVFLRVYAATGSIADACRAADIDPSVHYRRLDRDRAYREEFEKTARQVGGLLEDELMRRAIEGDPIFKDGEIAGTRKSMAALAMAIKAALPAKYRENYKAEPVARAVRPELAALSDDELDQLEQLLRKATPRD